MASPIRVPDFDANGSRSYREGLHGAVDSLAMRSDECGRKIEGALGMLAEKTVEMQELRAMVGRLRTQADEQVNFNQQLREAVEDQVKRAHAELKEGLKEYINMTRAAAEASHGGSGAVGRRPDFDERKLKISPYSGEKATWRDFAWTLSAFVGREAPHLKKAMATAENRTEEITEDDVLKMGVSAELDGALMHLLVNNVAQGSEAFDKTVTTNLMLSIRILIPRI